VVRHLGERFGRGDADRYRDACPLHHARPQLAGMRLQAMLEPVEAQKRLVDRIEFEIGGERGQHAHDARAHVAVYVECNVKEFSGAQLLEQVAFWVRAGL
jgi:hypothetical protein